MSSSSEAKAIGDAMTALWEREFPATVRVLAAVHDGDREYRPDAKTRSAWQLVTHIATADAWFIDSICRGAFHFDPDAAKRAEARFENVRDVVAHYEATMPQMFARLRALPGEQLAEELDFFGMFSMTRAAWIGFANNHSVHHRGQLSSYLRALGSRVPDIYGPSGDAEPAQASA